MGQYVARARGALDQHRWPCFFGAICPAKGKGAVLRRICPGAFMYQCRRECQRPYAVLIASVGTSTPQLAILDNIILALPPRSPELNPGLAICKLSKRRVAAEPGNKLIGHGRSGHAQGWAHGF